MCRAVRFRFDERDWQVRFSQHNARLPLFNPRSKEIALFTWGRRPREISGLPNGGWARRVTIQSGRWDKFNPKPVRILLNAFMEMDVAGKEQWFEVTKGNFVQGLLATFEMEKRVYVVSLDTSLEETHFERWPRIIASPD